MSLYKAGGGIWQIGGRALLRAGAAAGYPRPASSLMLKTTSTSAAWTPQNVTKSGGTMTWYLIDADDSLVATQDANKPTFDLSALAGTKTMYATSPDGWSGFTIFACYSNGLTALGVSTNTALETLYCHINNMTTLDVSANTALTLLSCRNNSLTSGVIDQILIDLAAEGDASGILRYDGQSPAANPTSASYAAYNTLDGLNWTLTGTAPPAP